MDPVIIEGTPRSGTRFFCHFLETEFNIKIFRLQRIFRKYSDVTQRYGGLDLSGNFRKLLIELNNEMIFQERVGSIDPETYIHSTVDRTFSAILNKILSDRATEEKFDAWGLKFDNPSGFDMCNSYFPNSKFIHIIRDGRDVHLSACQCLSEGYYTPYNNSIFWKKLVEERRGYGKHLGGDRYLEVKYERLLEKPEALAKEIAEFLKIEHYNYQEIGILRDNFNKWKTEMSSDHIRLYEAIAGDLLTELGYEVLNPDAKVSPIEALYHKTIEKPLKIKKYLKEMINEKTRARVIRRIKMKINDYL